MEWFYWDDHRKIFSECQWMAKVPNGIEILPKISTRWVGRTNVQTDDRHERKREFKFAKNDSISKRVLNLLETE